MDERGMVMTDREKVIAAYDCHMTNLSDSKCENCPYSYAYIDRVDGKDVVECNTTMMLDDAITLLFAQEPNEADGT